MAANERRRRSYDPYAAQLELLRKASEAGSELASNAALSFYALYNKPPLDWIAAPAAQSFCNYLNQNNPKRRGRSAGLRERCQQNMIDVVR